MATDFAAVGISVDTGDLKRAVDLLPKLGKESGKAETRVNKLGKETDSLAKKTLNVNSAMTKLAGTLSLLALANKARELIQFADSMTLLDSRIKIATRSTEDYITSQKLLVDISLRTGSALESNIILFSRINKSIGDMGGTIHETARVTETLVKALTISGATASETTSVVRQMSQALASGVLRGDEFNSIVENGARVQGILADSLDVTKGELRDMAQTGQLTSTKVINALIEQSKIIDAEFARMPVTVNRALNNITTSFGVYILEVNKGIGATAGIADSLNLLADNLIPVIESIVTLGKVALAVFAGSMLKSLSSYIPAKTKAIELEYAHATAIKENIQFDNAKAKSNQRLAATELAKTEAIISNIKASGLNQKAAQNSIKANLAKIDSDIKAAKTLVAHTSIMANDTKGVILQQKAVSNLAKVQADATVQRAKLSESIAIERNANLLLAESQAILIPQKEALVATNAGLAASNEVVAASTATLSKSMKSLVSVSGALNLAIGGYIAYEVAEWIGGIASATEIAIVSLSALAAAITTAALSTGTLVGGLAVLKAAMLAHPITAFVLGVTALTAAVIAYKRETETIEDLAFLPKAEALDKSLKIIEETSKELNKVKELINNDLGINKDAVIPKELLDRYDDLDNKLFKAAAASKLFGATQDDIAAAMGGNVEAINALKEANEKAKKAILDANKLAEKQNAAIKKSTKIAKDHTKALKDQERALAIIVSLSSKYNEISDISFSSVSSSELKIIRDASLDNIGLLKEQRIVASELAKENIENLDIVKDLEDAMKRVNVQIDKNIKVEKASSKEIKVKEKALKELEKAQSDVNRAYENLETFGDLRDIFPSVSDESLRLLEKYSKDVLPDTIAGLEALEVALKEQKAVWAEYSSILQNTFSDLLSDGQSFTENLADMFDNMIDRMLNKALEFASNAIINSLFGSGSFGSGLFGAAVGAAAIGVSYLLSDNNEPRRSDIAPSRTTTSGDDRALGFAEMVAADIGVRDYIYAQQLIEFRELNNNLKITVNNIGLVYKALDFSISDAFDSFLSLDGVNDLAGFVSQYTSSFTNILSEITGAVDIFIDPLSELITTGIGSVVDIVSDFVPDFFSGFGDEISIGIQSSLADVITPAFESGIYTASSSLEVAISEAITPIFESAAGQAAASAQASAEGALAGAQGTLVSALQVIGTIYSIYSIIADWDETTIEDKVISIVQLIATVVGGPIAWIVAALINVYKTVDKIIEGDYRGALDQALFGGLDAVISDLLGIPSNVEMIVDNPWAAGPIGPSVQIMKWFGLFDERVPNAWFNTGYERGNTFFGEGQRFENPDEFLTRDNSFSFGNKSAAITALSPFGTTTFSTHEASHSQAQIDSFFGGVLDLVVAIDVQMANAINKMDGVDTGIGETLQFYIDTMSGSLIKFRTDLSGLNVANLLESRYKSIIDILGRSGTAVGVAFKRWVDLFKDKFGPENILSIIQNVSANFEGLFALPIELIALLDNNIKSFRLGGTPEDAVKEMNAIVTTYALLKIGLESLGADNISGVSIVSFLAKMNNVGFAVNEAGASLLQYAQILKISNVDISHGINELFSFANNANFNKRDYSNFFSTIGAFASLGQSLDIKPDGLNDFLEISRIVGEIAEQTLDLAQYDTLKEQAVQYGGLTVAQARAEIESLGIATADAVLEVVNNVVFLNNALEITGNSFSSMGKSLLETVQFSQDLIEMMGGLDEAENKWSAFIQAMYTDIEIANINYRQASRSANELLTSIGLGGLAFDEFRIAFDNALPRLSAEELRTWIDTGIAIGAANDAMETASDLLVSQFEEINNAATQRYETELQYINQINDFVDSLLVNEALSPLTNKERLVETQSQFATQLSLAKAGDTDALGSITQFANKYLTEARSFYASGEVYQNVFDNVSSSLLGVSAELGSADVIDPLHVIDNTIKEQTLDLIAASTLDTEIIINALERVFSYEQLDSFGLIPTEEELNYASDVNFINSLFQDAFGFLPDQFNFDLWMDKLLSGESRLLVSSQFETLADPFADLPTFADGGFHSGGLAVVGDTGPELVNFSRPSQIYTSSQTSDIFSGNNESSKELVDLIKQLIQENRELTESLIEATYDSSEQNADSINNNDSKRMPTRMAVT